MLGSVTAVFEAVVEYCELVIEIIGAFLLAASVIRALAGWFKGDKHVSLQLLSGLSTALTFLLCGEVMHTIIVETWDELLILGATMLLRAAITLLLHWEKKQEEHE